MHKKRCIICEKVFETSRSHTKTCSNGCRSKLARIKKAKFIKSQAEELVSLKSKFKQLNFNRYFSSIDGHSIMIESPEGTDITKLLNLHMDAEGIVKQINSLPIKERKLYKVKKLK